MKSAITNLQVQFQIHPCVEVSERKNEPVGRRRRRRRGQARGGGWLP